MKKSLVFRVETKADAEKVFKFFYDLRDKTVKIDDIIATRLGRGIKTILLRVEEVEEKEEA